MTLTSLFAWFMTDLLACMMSEVYKRRVYSAFRNSDGADRTRHRMRGVVWTVELSGEDEREHESIT